MCLSILKVLYLGVSGVAQWVKDLTAAAWVAAEGWVCSPAWHSELRIWLWLGLDPWPGNLHMLWVQPLKKNPKTTTATKTLDLFINIFL